MEDADAEAKGGIVGQGMAVSCEQCLARGGGDDVLNGDCCPGRRIFDVPLL